MKKLIEFAKSLTPTAWILVIVICMGLAFGAVSLVGKVSSAINDHRISLLETEKQDALKQAAAAHDRNLILQGEVKAKNETISDLTSQIADSNQRVSNAHKDTQTARQNLNQVRADKPRFNATDDAGRIDELGAGLQRLYPDSP